MIVPKRFKIICHLGITFQSERPPTPQIVQDELHWVTTDLRITSWKHGGDSS